MTEEERKRLEYIMGKKDWINDKSFAGFYGVDKETFLRNFVFKESINPSLHQFRISDPSKHLFGVFKV
jgi:hypothetical protein